jgi:hypothetical protein
MKRLQASIKGPLARKNNPSARITIYLIPANNQKPQMLTPSNPEPEADV